MRNPDVVTAYTIGFFAVCFIGLITIFYYEKHRIPRIKIACEKQIEVARAKAVMLRIQCNKKNPNEYFINKNQVRCANVY